MKVTKVMDEMKINAAKLNGYIVSFPEIINVFFTKVQLPSGQRLTCHKLYASKMKWLLVMMFSAIQTSSVAKLSQTIRISTGGVIVLKIE